MNLFPHDTETLVVSRSAPEVIALLKDSCLSENIVHNPEEHQQKLFTGSVHDSTFQLSVRPKRPNSFLPLMHGTVEAANSGCIVFVTYGLFPSTRMYLAFWSLFVVMAGIVGALRVHGIYIPAATVLALGLIQYIAWANFNMQVRISRNILMKSLS